MAAMSDYLENKLVDHILRGQSFSAPATTYVALFTAAPTDAGGGTEVTGNNYARKAVSSSLVNWLPTQGSESPMGVSSGTGGLTANAALIQFATPSGSWGTVTHWGLFDALTNGNLLFHGALAASKSVQSGDDVSFVAGALQLTFA